MKNKIRTLRDDEPLPDGAPRRYTSRSHGYIVLRWRVSCREFVECYEHRVVAGRPPGMAVHHVDGDHTNNTRENLAVMTHAEHNALHGASKRTIDRAQIREMYARGMSTVDIAAAVGRDASAVWRALKRDGVPMRPRSDCVKNTRRDVDHDEVERLYRGGMSPDAIAKRFRCSPPVIYGVIKTRNLPRRPPGRPRVKK